MGLGQGMPPRTTCSVRSPSECQVLVLLAACENSWVHTSPNASCILDPKARQASKRAHGEIPLPTCWVEAWSLQVGDRIAGPEWPGAVCAGPVRACLPWLHPCPQQVRCPQWFSLPPRLPLLLHLLLQEAQLNRYSRGSSV